MQSGNEEDIQSEQSFKNLIEEDEGIQHSRSSKRKKFKIDLKNKKSFFVPLILASLILITYYSTAYVFSESIANKFSVFVQEINITN